MSDITPEMIRAATKAANKVMEGIESIPIEGEVLEFPKDTSDALFRAALEAVAPLIRAPLEKRIAELEKRIDDDLYSIFTSKFDPPPHDMGE